MFGLKIYKKKDIEKILDQTRHAKIKADILKTELDEMFNGGYSEENFAHYSNLRDLRKGISWNLSNIEEIIKR